MAKPGSSPAPLITTTSGGGFWLGKAKPCLSSSRLLPLGFSFFSLPLVKTMEVLGLWSRSHEAHGLAMVVGLNRGLCRGWWVFGRGGGCLTALRLWV
uniref:Uncharacterized protein n=1 Tax=Fagus sylvatica TaxID=28930 RepID=A0A2N9I066_FAGSY